MVDPDPNAPSATQADRLIATVSTLAQSLNVLTDRMTHARRFTRWLAVSVAVSALCLLGVILALARAADAADDAKDAAAANKATIYDTCVAANDARNRNVQLWEKLLALDPPGTPEAQARADQVRAAVNATFIQRNCGG